MKRLSWSAVLLAVVVCSCSKPPAPAPVVWERAPEFGDAFWQHWGDGRAEMAGYDLVTPRYGALRRGTAVAITVTETFSNEARVKADPGRHPPKDEFPVLKLNLVQDFATGIYDYQLMTSAFAALTSVNSRPPGALTKVSFGAQEWCGHVYAQMLFDASYARYTGHSYFDGEADSASAIPSPNDALSEDGLLLWARGFAAPVLARGDSATATVTGSLRHARLLHQRIVSTSASLARAATTETITVPAGTFECEVARVRIQGGRSWTFWVEAAAPHRIVQWTCDDGEQARLLASDRLAYWGMNGEGAERELARLGLTARAPRMP